LIYNGIAVHSGELAPEGWHVPTYIDWQILTGFYGENTGDLGKLMETGTVHWRSPNTCATNETGFTALPGGNRSHDGQFRGIGHFGDFWCTECSWGVSCNGFEILNEYGNYGAYVRCVKDLPE
jgi:uncharacterized protein (TIGR02145 family)